MQFWLTTHWPPTEWDPTDFRQHGVYLPHGRESAANDMEKGDLVFIYESKTGRLVRERYPDGSHEDVPRLLGREGIGALAEVLRKPVEDEESEEEEYSDSTRIWWRYYAPTKPINSKGFVPRQDVAKILGYKVNYPFRGFGDAHSGLKKLDYEEYKALLKKFLDHQNLRVKPTAIGGKRVWGYGEGGEGETHKRLKELIASDPSRYLGEVGLSTLEVEHEFETGDRVDILLQDSFGRPVVVEVEPECLANQFVGPMQCMKYRALAAFGLNFRTDEVRAFLAAASIDPSVKECCKKWEIDSFEVDQ
jgi:hypothetical protein